MVRLVGPLTGTPALGFATCIPTSQELLHHGKLAAASYPEQSLRLTAPGLGPQNFIGPSGQLSAQQGTWAFWELRLKAKVVSVPRVTEERGPCCGQARIGPIPVALGVHARALWTLFAIKLL